MWKSFRKIIVNLCTKYQIKHNYHYWQPVWFSINTPPGDTFGNYRNEINNDPVAGDDEIITENWPPGYQGHKCLKCGEIRRFQGMSALKKLKSRGCSKLAA